MEEATTSEGERGQVKAHEASSCHSSAVTGYFAAEVSGLTRKLKCRYLFVI
jgi:hypothetical protein